MIAMYKMNESSINAVYANTNMFMSICDCSRT